jgi:dihydropyrimidine dehydrogenase (NAD+) subunit PreA
VTDIAFVAQAAKENGADALCAINTVSGMISVDLDTLTPLPTVGGVSTWRLLRPRHQANRVA